MNTAKPLFPAGWHPADIKAALEKRGYSFRRIAREMDYALKSCDSVLRRPMGPVEERVAEIIGVPAAELWPSRYVVPLRRLGRWHQGRRAGAAAPCAPHADRRTRRAA